MRIIFAILFFLMTGGYAIADTWQPIIGIPEPPFGITTSHMMYADPSYTYDYGNGPEPYRIGPDGPYTHYVNPDHPSATDTDNPYGTHTTPRITRPNSMHSLPAGSVMELHGGPHNISGTLTGSGTSSLPIFIRGVEGEEPIFQGVYDFEGDYYVIENVKFDLQTYARKTLRIGVYSPGARTHIAIRNNEFYNGQYNPTSSYQVVRLKHEHNDTQQIKNIVIYKNHFHNIGDGRTERSGTDVTCVAIDQNIENVWIIDNHMHHIGGDGVQVATDTPDDNAIIANHIYIGRNTIHDNFENAVDLKICRDIVVSQNTAYNFGEEYSIIAGEGAFRYGGGEGGVGEQRANIWTLFNHVYNNAHPDGAFYSYSGEYEVYADEIYFIGNVVHDCHNIEGSAAAFGAWNQKEIYWLNNVVYNCDRGFGVLGDILGTLSEESMTIINNIIGDLHQDTKYPYHLTVGGLPASLDRSVIRNNIFYESSGDVNIRYGVTNTETGGTAWTEYTYPQFCEAYPSKCIDSMEDNPDHVDAANADFRLKLGSPAIDTGVLHAAYATFKARYGINIQVDYNNNDVPYGTIPDIGAYEFFQLYKPTNLRIKDLTSP